MTECFIQLDYPKAMCRCDNCGHRCRANKLEMVSDIQERINPGCIVPAGQCPKCGALSYLENPPLHTPAGELRELKRVKRPASLPPLMIALEGGLVQSIASSNPAAFGRVFVCDYDTEGAAPSEVTMIPQEDGSDSDAIFREEPVCTATVGLDAAIARLDGGENCATGVKGRLPGDTARQEQSVRKAGWVLDFDGFWRRRRKAGEPDVADACEGLTGNEFGRDYVYMRSAKLALAYDTRCKPVKKTRK